MKREKRTETNEGDEREISGEKGIIKYYYFFLQYCYSAIL